MKKIIVSLLLAAVMVLSVSGCGSSQTESTVSEESSSEVSDSEKRDVIAALMGTVRHFESDLELPDRNDDYTVAYIDDHYCLVTTAKRPDGSNAAVTFYVDLNGDDYSVHYFSVKETVYVDDGVIED